MNFTRPAVASLDEHVRRLSCVVVTYGDRRKLLEQVVRALPSEGVANAVVVNNNCTWDVQGVLNEQHGSFVHVLTMASNSGSARAFGAGIERAIELGAEYILLLDDDTRPQPGMVRGLMSAYIRATDQTPRDRLAMAALRVSQDAGGILPRQGRPRSNSFRGFHVRDIPKRFLASRRPGEALLSSPQGSDNIEVHVAPYAGLLFHRDLVAEIGLPDPKFVVYVDDYDFTYRIHARGGRVLVVPEAALDDLEPSWNNKRLYGGALAALLRAPDDARAYYMMRNRAYFDALYLEQRHAVFTINRGIYMLVLALLALRYGALRRYKVLTAAVADGLAGRLGRNPQMGLPGE